MFVGIGIGIARRRFAGSFAGSYSSRVIADSGTIEALDCVAAASSLLQSASLLIIPSGYKAGVAYAELPANGNGDLSWFRASSALRTLASGTIETPRTNHIRNSSMVGASTSPSTLPTNWVSQATAGLTLEVASTGIENGLDYVDIRYSGTTTATTIRLFWEATNQIVAADGQVWTSSFWTSISGSALPPNYRLGVATNTSAGFSVSAIVATPSITQSTTLTRYDRVMTLPGGATVARAQPGIYVTLVNGQTYDFTIRIAAPQFEFNSQVTDWIRTTTSARTTFAGITQDGLSASNIPRLDYTYGSCPALLLEPQRTNLLLQSEDLTTASWVKSDVTATANSIVAPDGNSTADTLTATATTGIHNVQNGPHTATTTTASIYAKKGTHNFLQIYSGVSSQASANFNLNTGVVGTFGTLATASIQNVGNGWYRCIVTITSPSSGSTFRWAMVTSASAAFAESWTATGSENLYLWGGQVEAGAYATTYIQTGAATATRLVDSFTRNNIYTNGLISASGGTWFVELRNNVSYLRDVASDPLELGDAGVNNGFIIRPSSVSSRLFITKRQSGVLSTLFTTTTDTVKIAIKWNGTSADVFVNGVKQVSATAFTTTIMENLNSRGNAVPIFIQAMALYPTPLSDAQCQALTT